MEFWFAIAFAIAKDYVWRGRMTRQPKVGGIVRPHQLKVAGVCFACYTVTEKGPTLAVFIRNIHTHEDVRSQYRYEHISIQAKLQKMGT